MGHLSLWTALYMNLTTYFLKNSVSLTFNSIHNRKLHETKAMSNHF